MDEISTVEINMIDSTFTGSISAEGIVNVTLDESSTWTLTADTYITAFIGDLANVIANGYTLYINGEAAN